MNVRVDSPRPLAAKTWVSAKVEVSSAAASNQIVSYDDLQPRGTIFLDLAETFWLLICGDCITMVQKPEEQHSLYTSTVTQWETFIPGNLSLRAKFSKLPLYRYFA
jgi:hypothetical protein